MRDSNEIEAQTSMYRTAIYYGDDGRYSLFLNSDGSVTAVLADEGADSYEAAPASQEGAEEYRTMLAAQQAAQSDPEDVS